MSNSFVQKLGMDLPDETKFYGIEPQHTARSIMFELRTRDGKCKAYAYSYMTEAIFEPETGIIIHVSDVTITIKGRALNDIYRHLLANRINYIQEDFSGIDTNESDLFVEAIEITPRNDNEA